MSLSLATKGVIFQYVGGGGSGGTVYVPVTNPSSSAFEFGTVKSSAHVVLPQVTTVEEFKPVVKAEEG